MARGTELIKSAIYTVMAKTFFVSQTRCHGSDEQSNACFVRIWLYRWDSNQRTDYIATFIVQIKQPGKPVAW